uniref:Uncharacterized protein LOC111119132 n=1 Tax=Crassostrea virginica TaxID=6565 RepID=A0A8B8CJW1_CRAVI|nr:uncharacterized protein LOC111119132 [Crassostrea virginica]
MATSVSISGSEEDRTRFFRLSLVIIDELKRILQDLVENEVPSAQIFQKVKQVNYLKKLRPEQIAVIKNASSRGYQDFDVTLLYTLLRNVCQNITPPSQNWGVYTMPSPNEVTLGDDIERIRLIRNKFGHISETAISKTEFNEYWSIISGICTRIQTLLNKDYVKRLQDAEGCSMDSDTEKKYLELIRTMAEEEKSTRDILQNIQSTLTELTSKETIKIQARVAEKGTIVETFIDTSISILNEMVAAVHEMTSESDIHQIYESIDDFIRENKEKPENLQLQNLFKTLIQKMKVYAKKQKTNQIKILANFNKFCLRMKREYGAQIECSKSSILLHVTCSSKSGYVLYKKDLENGQIGEHLLELFLFPPFLSSFGLKEDDIEIMLNDRLLTQRKDSLQSFINFETVDPQYSCDLCKTPAPSRHCDICLSNLCEACIEKHLSDQSKDHYIVPFKLRGIAPKCQEHSTKVCKELCITCNKPLCYLCEALGEHKKHNKEDILEMFESKKKQMQNDLLDLKKSIFPKYQEFATNIPVQKAEVIKHSEKLTTALEKQEEALHTEIATIVQEMKSKIHKMDDKNIRAIDQQEKDINHTITEISQVIRYIQKLLDSDDVYVVSEYTSRTEEFKTLPFQFRVNFLTFIPKEINKEKIYQQIGYLANLNIESQAKCLTEKYGSPIKTLSAVCPPPARVFLDDPVVVNEINSGYGNYSLHSVSCRNDSEFWTCSFNDNIMKLFNLQGKLLRMVQTKSRKYPEDIAVTQNGDLMYADHHDSSIYLVSGEQRQTVVTLRGWRPLSLCSTSFGLPLVIMDSEELEQTKVVCYYRSTGKKNIQWDDQNNPLYTYGYAKYITENRNLDICVADFNACAVVVVSTTGKLLFKYTGSPSTPHKSFDPVGIATDSKANILISDCNSFCIHIIDQDGHFLRFIDNCKLRTPRGLCVDSKDNLFVTEEYKGEVKKIKYYK